MKQEKIKNKILRFLLNVSTSGKYEETKSFGASDYLIRYVLLNFIAVFGIFILSAFIVLDFRLQRYFTVGCCIGMIITASASFILARTRVPQIIPALLLLISYGLLCVTITWTGESYGANFLFIYMYPLLTIMLIGMRFGASLSVILIMIVSAEMFIPGLSRYSYHFDFSIRMLANYLLVFSVMVVIEITRGTKDRHIEAQNRELFELNRQLVSANEKLEALSTTDELTKLNNRRSFIHHIEIIWKQNHRLNLPITMIMVDIDFFKKYNDSFGHLEGDKALIAVAQCMKNQLKRETDLVARYGGEEFICLLPYIEKAEAMVFAERLVQSAEDMQIPHPLCGHSKYITISAGMASAVPDGSTTWEHLLDEADKALYRAKQSGRNRVATLS